MRTAKRNARAVSCWRLRVGCRSGWADVTPPPATWGWSLLEKNKWLQGSLEDPWARANTAGGDFCSGLGSACHGHQLSPHHPTFRDDRDAGVFYKESFLLTTFQGCFQLESLTQTLCSLRQLLLGPSGRLSRYLSPKQLHSSS